MIYTIIIIIITVNFSMAAKDGKHGFKSSNHNNNYLAVITGLRLSG